MQNIISQITLIKSDTSNPGYKKLLPILDAELRVMDGDDHAFYAQYNKSDEIKHVIIGYMGDEAIACGAIKHYGESTAEVKRMYVAREYRGNGIARHLLAALEDWAIALGYKDLVLETGKENPAAVNAYLKCNYVITENYGQYIGKELSVCMAKRLV